MKHIRGYGRFVETLQDAMYDILASGRDDPRRRELEELINSAEEEGSEDGRAWSDSEREAIDRKVRALNPALARAPEVKEDPRDREDRLLQNARREALQVVDRVEASLSADDDYEPHDPAAAAKLPALVAKVRKAARGRDTAAIEAAVKELETQGSLARFTYDTRSASRR